MHILNIKIEKMNNQKSPKVFIPKVKESWVVDRFRIEWIKGNKELFTKNIFQSDTVWIIAPWIWKKIPRIFLIKKKVLCTIHHFEDRDLTGDGLKDFYRRDKYITAYHVISKPTYEQLKKLTGKSIFCSPFWVNEKIWYEIEDKSKLKDKLGIEKSDYLVGSFQRDTEGHDLKSPKLIKGPDRLLQILQFINNEKKDLLVILAGTRRQYLINKLNEMSIKFKYFELTDYKKLNELYNILDLYIVSSRVEGGPQAILECSITKTPVISTDVGIAKEILSQQSIFNMNNYKDAKPDIVHAYNKAKNLTYSNHIDNFNKMFFEL